MRPLDAESVLGRLVAVLSRRTPELRSEPDTALAWRLRRLRGDLRTGRERRGHRSGTRQRPHGAIVIDPRVAGDPAEPSGAGRALRGYLVAAVVTALILGGTFAGGFAAGTAKAPGPGSVTTVSPAPSTPLPVAAGPLASGESYLALLRPISSGVEGLTNGDVSLTGTPYPQSVRFACAGGSALSYAVSGSTRLSATVGVPDDATGAVGTTVTLTFYKDDMQQLRSPVPVSSGHPQRIYLDLQGASQLVISCQATRDPTGTSTSVDVALGTAVLEP